MADNDKLLLWWTVSTRADRYRVVDGNLETELIDGDWWGRLRAGKSPRGDAPQFALPLNSQ
jgi:hypothetical protein